MKTCYVIDENKSEVNELAKSNTHTQNETNQEKILSYVHRKIFIPITKNWKSSIDLEHSECVYSVWLQLMCCICMSKCEISKAMMGVN